jgi:hypothetical protein
MHKVNFLICFILLTAVSTRAQSKLQEPPKKASKIIILIKDSANTLLNTIAKGLFDKGFTIDTKDENTKTISTKEFAPNHPSLFIKIRASINDSGVVFTGSYNWTLTTSLLPSAQTFDPIEFRGMKNSAAMQTWNSLDAIAKTFGDKVVYSK